eukprot:scaffold52699_cov24-Tisochrysis_lutea.AAC.1
MHQALRGAHTCIKRSGAHVRAECSRSSTTQSSDAPHKHSGVHLRACSSQSRKELFYMHAPHKHSGAHVHPCMHQLVHCHRSIAHATPLPTRLYVVDWKRSSV